jgi:Rrf2 family protein
MKLSTRSRYALRVLVELARRYGMGLVPLGEITRAQNLSLEYVENILRKLVQAGIVELRRGVNGGGRLVRDPSSLTVWEVLHEVENFELVPCENHPEGSPRCPRYGDCSARCFWAGLGKTVKAYLASKTIADVAREVNKAGSSWLFSDNI